VPALLPVGKTERGFYATAAPESAELAHLTTANITFPIPTTAAVKPANAIYVNKEGKAFNAEGASAEGVCTGTVAAPTAPSGDLCIYAGVENLKLETYHGIENRLDSPGTQKQGALLAFEVTETGEASVKASGTWAVTG
jgi:hypothetical protein